MPSAPIDIRQDKVAGLKIYNDDSRFHWQAQKKKVTGNRLPPQTTILLKE